MLDIDRDRQRISLGLKQTQEDPWQRVISTHRPGDVLEGQVTKVVAFGAFVEILPGVEGLVHISELADHHVENPSEVVEPGTSLNVKILEIDEERRRLSLSIKRVEGQNMPMQGLSEQIAAAEQSSEGSTAGPVAEDDSPALQESSPSTPPAGEAAEDSASEAAVSEEAGAEVPAASEEAEGEPVAEVAEDEAAPVEPVAEAENGSPAEEDAPSEAHEGESVEERPDSPDSTDEAAGDDAETGESEQS